MQQNVKSILQNFPVPQNPGIYLTNKFYMAHHYRLLEGLGTGRIKKEEAGQRRREVGGKNPSGRRSSATDTQSPVRI